MKVTLLGVVELDLLREKMMFVNFRKCIVFWKQEELESHNSF